MNERNSSLFFFKLTRSMTFMKKIQFSYKMAEKISRCEADVIAK